MTRLRYASLAVLVSLVSLAAIACGGADTGTSTPKVTGQEIADLLDDPDVFLLDVRGADELTTQGAIEGYTLIPIGELADRLDELPRDKKILTI